MPALIAPSRRISPADTLAAIRPVCAELGILGFADHTPEGVSLIRSVEILRRDSRSGYLTLGKGFGLEAALASGYMEAIEIATIERSPETPLITIAETDRDGLVYSAADKSIRHSGAVRSELSGCAVVRGVDLLTGRACHGFRDDLYLPAVGGPDPVRPSPNGLSSGNTLAEARLHAVYEILERHVGRSSLETGANVTGLELQDMPPVLHDAILEIESLGMQCEFFQLGRPYDVHVVQCVIAFEPWRGQQPRISFGWGSHHGPAIAVAGALGEAVQVFATRKAIRAGAIPSSRLAGGLLVSARQLSQLASDSSASEHALHSRLRACPSRRLSLDAGSDPPSTSASELLAGITALMQRSDVSHLFSWTLSSDHYPFSVVKCVVPEFGTFVP